MKLNKTIIATIICAGATCLSFMNALADNPTTCTSANSSSIRFHSKVAATITYHIPPNACSPASEKGSLYLGKTSHNFTIENGTQVHIDVASSVGKGNSTYIMIKQSGLVTCTGSSNDLHCSY